MQKIAQNGYLMVTWANFHYFDFVKTWVKHVQRVGVTGYIVGAMDDHLLREMIKLEYNCFSMKSGLTLGDFGWGSATFAKMGREKIRLISIFLKLDVHVVIADVDVLWLRNPLPYFERYPEADILTSSDNMANTVRVCVCVCVRVRVCACACVHVRVRVRVWLAAGDWRGCVWW